MLLSPSQAAAAEEAESFVTIAEAYRGELHQVLCIIRGL